MANPTDICNNSKCTPLFKEHIKLGAAMVDFSGWYMPVQYTNVIEEHLAVRNNVGIFDVCHMGEFIVSGSGSLEFLQHMATNDISKLELNQACYNCMCNESGNVIDDLFIYKLKEDEFFVVVNAGTIEKDFNWLLKHKPSGIELKNISEQTAKIDVQGPYAEALMQTLTSFCLEGIKRFSCSRIKLNFMNEELLISRTGYTGEDGFELYLNPEHASLVWNRLIEAGSVFNIKPCGLGARDTLRIESCYSLYGHEINENTTPIEAGLGFAVKFAKDFIGRDVLEKQKAYGAEKKLVCFEMIDKSVPRESYDIIIDNKKIGYVTSGTYSPLFRKGIGMGYIESAESDLCNVGNEICILIRGKQYKAVIVERPFYKFRGGKL